MDETRSDDNSGYVQGSGFNCANKYGVYLDFTVSPHKNHLDKTYTTCEKLEQSDGDRICVRSLDWKDSPIDFELWESSKKSIEVKITFFAKQIYSTQFCRRHFDFKSIITARYELIQTSNMGDLRDLEDNVFYKNRIMENTRSILTDMIKFPKDRTDFINLFPIPFEY